VCCPAPAAAEASPGASVDANGLPAAAALGQKIFNDPALSASGKMSCATCHDPALGHASPFDAAVVGGGPGLDQPGTRTPPTLNYLRYNTSFLPPMARRPAASPGMAAPARWPTRPRGLS
jgi:cytochrome c peroxidase